MRRIAFTLLLLAGLPTMARAADIATSYAIPGSPNAPRTAPVVTLCPSTDGSNTAIACPAASGTAGTPSPAVVSVQGVAGGTAQPTKPGTLTIVPLDVAVVTTGGTAVTALTMGHATAGGFLVTSNAAGICVNQQGAAGTSTAGGTVCVAQNQMYTLVPNGNAVSVNSTAAVAIGGEGLN
jgi:hypothetical protein